ncbi:MAG: DUF6660 family protein [Ferruginibacter sp.]
MKFLGHIFALYLLALSCVPCGDRDEAKDKAIQNISATTNHQPHQQGNEVCTPFCTCACCAASAFFQPTVSFKIPKLVFKTVIINYETSFQSYDFHSVWEPPKIG